jgi:hypothetical protein
LLGEVELGSGGSKTQPSLIWIKAVCIEDGNYETVTTPMQPSVIVWDLETVPDLGGFAAANDLVGKSDVEVREAIGDKFPKHIYHSIVCIGALIAHWEADHWAVDAVGASLNGVSRAIGKNFRAGTTRGTARAARALGIIVETVRQSSSQSAIVDDAARQRVLNS